MSKRTSYPSGAPNWVTLLTQDPAGARAFYGDLFGWRFTDLDSGSRRYTVAHHGEAVVAAIAEADPVPGGPAQWMSFFAVDDVDRVVRAVPPAGGVVSCRPVDVLDQGRIALVQDPTGALVGLWQAGRRAGADLMGDPGTAAWFELLTTDVDAAARFYRRVLGLGTEAEDLDGIPWTTLQVDTVAVAGVVGKLLTGTSNRWNVYFATDDIHELTRRATDHGATVTVGPLDTSIGPMAGIQDPQGARFSLWTLVQVPVPA